MRSDERIFRETYAAVIAAVDSGRLCIERLRDAARRVDQLVAQADSWRQTPPPTAAAGADQIAAARALRTTGHVRGRFDASVTVVDVRRRRNVAAGRTSGLIADALVAALPGSRAVAAFEQGAVVEGHAGEATGEAQLPAHADIVVTGSPWLDEVESTALRTVLAGSPDAVVVCTGWATGTDQLAPARHTVRTVGEDLPTARAVTDLLVRR